MTGDGGGFPHGIGDRIGLEPLLLAARAATSLLSDARFMCTWLHEIATAIYTDTVASGLHLDLEGLSSDDYLKRRLRSAANHQWLPVTTPMHLDKYPLHV